jgi:hypothetical protein
MWQGWRTGSKEPASPKAPPPLPAMEGAPMVFTTDVKIAARRLSALLFGPPSPVPLLNGTGRLFPIAIAASTRWF